MGLLLTFMEFRNIIVDQYKPFFFSDTFNFPHLSYMTWHVQSVI